MAIRTITAGTLFDSSDELAAIAVHPRETADPGAVLRRLGPPPGFDSLAELEAAVAGAAARAWQLAQHRDREDPLLAALRNGAARRPPNWPMPSDVPPPRYGSPYAR